jgi:hypothetical protein
MKFFHGSARKNGLFLRAKKIGEMGELFQFKVAANVSGRCVAEGELVLSKQRRPRRP